MKLYRVLFLVVVAAAICPLLQGAAIYTAVGDSTFSIGGPRTVAVGSAAGSIDVTGDGYAEYHAVYSVGGVFPATLHVDVAGSADAPPNSTATSTYESGHFFTIDNPGPVPITIGFGFSYSWSVSVAAGDPAWEGAAAGVFFHITSADHGTFAIGGDSLTEFLFNPTASTSLGPLGTSGSGSIGGTLTVPAFTLAAFSVITDASGFAHSETPEPGTLVMGGVGLAILCFVKRGRRTGRA